MQPAFTLTEHHRLLVLYKVIMMAKFSKEALADPVIAASPFLADMARDVVDTLIAIEELQGNETAKDKWALKITVGGATWKIALRNAREAVGQFWTSWSEDKKQEVARIFLSPFTISSEIVDAFVKEIDETLNETKSLDAEF
jgi:hypothetical protein